MLGRDKIYARQVAILNSIPDFYVAYTAPMLFRRYVCFKNYAYGTSGAMTGLNNSPKTDYLWNPFKAYPEEKLTEKMQALKVKYNKWMSEGKLIRGVHKTIFFFVMNEEMTHFEQRIVHSDSLELFEAKVEDFFKE